MTTIITHARRLAVGLVAVATAAMFAPAVAVAGSSGFGDPTETANPEDITHVNVRNARHVAVTVKQQQMRRNGSDLPIRALISISTGPQYDGPEWLIQQSFYTEGGPNLRRTEGWDGPRGPFKKCSADLKWRPSRDTIRFSVPRRCIDKPNEVQVNVTYRFFMPVGKRKIDYAPARRVLGPIVGAF